MIHTTVSGVAQSNLCLTAYRAQILRFCFLHRKMPKGLGLIHSMTQDISKGRIWKFDSLSTFREEQQKFEPGGTAETLLKCLNGI